MGRPGTGSSPYVPQRQPQNQSEYDLQPQEYQYDATHETIASTGDHEQAFTNESNHYVEENQSEQPNNMQAQAQAQQQFQPTQPPPQQQQPAQTNQQAYGAQPGRPIRMYENGQNQPGAYPPQAPQTVPAQPVNFPPASPQNNQMYQNGAYQQQQQQQQEGPGTTPAKPEQFPPAGPQKSPMFQNGQNRSPAYPQQGQINPVNFPPTMAQGVQFQQTNGQQHVQYGTNAVQGFPVQRPGPQPNQQGWTSGLFDCMNDPMNALITAVFPCLTFGQIAEIIDEGQTSCGTSGMLYGAIAFCISVPCIMSCTYRTKLRSKFGLPEAPAPDWITHFLCEWCAICQEYRELQSRGWDPSIGWQGNLARIQNMNQQQVAMMPPMNQRMMG